MISALICDGDPGIRASIRNELKELGFDSISEAVDGKSAVSMAFEGLPDIAIIDAACGLNSAREIIQKLRIPVILLMSHYDSDMLNQVKKIGITTTLSKPFRGQDLLPAIEMAVAHAKEVELLKTDVEKLNETIENQAVIYKAKKVLLRSGGLSESDAYRKIQKLAMDTKMSMRQIAETILINDRCGKREIHP
ncbi:MAG: ANTAR domain-containing protein [Oryzomonas sp.]|uniref:ANTAR domain-containing response regulator n=1 Tax=Oryzomonas sp. TaxID=2855186 RepID=UPI00283B229F|nr:ANTAR domain-containing protein [Oryzomonas sp.]MDR3580224.1 ANTAR domain-containing protein [Oryzomonas sp.]